jgi:glycosidase
VFYQIFVDRFGIGDAAVSAHFADAPNLEPWSSQPTATGYKGGNLQGIIDKLGYLRDLQITAIYLTPIFAAGSNHRYNTQDFYRIDPLLGDEAAFSKLLKSAHRQGIRVIVDGVFNHVGRAFHQFANVVENGPASPWVTWFRIQGWPISPYQHSSPPNYACWYGHRELPELNHLNPDVREYLMRVAERWTARGIDGWRLDAVESVNAPNFWREFRSRVRAINPDAYIVAEVVHDAMELLDGTQFDAATNYPFYTSTVGFVGGRELRRDYLKPARRFPRANAEAYGMSARRLFSLYSREVCLAQLNFLENHDTPRLMTVFGENRDLFLIANLLLFTSPGVPCLYYGSEVGLRGGRDPLCRGSFPPESDWDRELLAAIRDLVRLRRSLPALRTGDYEPLFARGRTLAFARRCESGAVIVGLNVGSRPTRISFEIPQSLARKLRRGSSVLWGAGFARLNTRSIVLEIPPSSGVVFGPPSST